jgi:hypothetical protein
MIKKVEKLYTTIPPIIFRNTYKVTLDNDIDIFVPINESNTDYQAIQKWIAEGGVVIDNPPTQENI